MDTYYRFIKSPLFTAENQHDANQIFEQTHAPVVLANGMEQATFNRYIGMYGQSMRGSIAQILDAVSASHCRL
jgi:hypothetical protein